MNRSSKLHAALAVCVFIFIGLGLALARPGLVDYAPYLSFSPDTDGVKGLRLLMEREGAEVKEWRLTPERLPDSSGRVLIAVQPYGVTAESASRLREWAAQGNEVIVFGSYPSWIEGWEAGYVKRDSEDGKVTAVLPDGMAAELEAYVETTIRLEPLGPPEERASEVRQRDAAGVLAVTQPVGDGAITVSVSSEWLTNGNVLEKSHFELAWLLLGGDALRGRTVYFDEYHHGYSVSPGLMQVYPMWLLAALLQAALASAAWLWWKGKRFGPAYTPRAFLVRRGDETLMAVAGWYRRGRLAFEALDHSVGQLSRALHVRAGVPPSAGAGQLAAGAERTLRGRARPPATLRDVLERWEALKKAKEAGGRIAYGDKEWLADSMVLDETLKLLEEAI